MHPSTTPLHRINSSYNTITYIYVQVFELDTEHTPSHENSSYLVELLFLCPTFFPIFFHIEGVRYALNHAWGCFTTIIEGRQITTHTVNTPNTMYIYSGRHCPLLYWIVTCKLTTAAGKCSTTDIKSTVQIGVLGCLCFFCFLGVSGDIYFLPFLLGVTTFLRISACLILSLITN